MTTPHAPSSPIVGSYTYSNLKVLNYGPGSVSTVVPLLTNTLHKTRALIITGHSLSTRTPVIKRVEALLGAHHVGTFTDIGEHSPVSGIKRAIEMVKETKADVLVSVGGGSPIDAAKVIAYYLREQEGGETLPSLAIPTTLSAAEYTMIAGYTSEEGQKVLVSGYDLAPAAIILDAELTLYTPERLWLSSGMRALDHAVENIYRPGNAYPIRALSPNAIADLFTYLPKSKTDPGEVEVRQRLQLAAWTSLFPNPRGGALGLSHALGHALGATYGIPHGITSCLTLASALSLKVRHLSDANPNSDSLLLLSRAHRLLPHPYAPSPPVHPDTDVSAASSLAHAIGQLVKDLGLQSTLKEYNVPYEDLKWIAEKVSATESSIAASEKEKVKEDEIEELLRQIYQ